jgi:hypothetical protein
MLKKLASMEDMSSARKETEILIQLVYFHWVRMRKPMLVSRSDLMERTEKKTSMVARACICRTEMATPGRFWKGAGSG